MKGELRLHGPPQWDGLPQPWHPRPLGTSPGHLTRMGGVEQTKFREEVIRPLWPSHAWAHPLENLLTTPRGGDGSERPLWILQNVCRGDGEGFSSTKPGFFQGLGQRQLLHYINFLSKSLGSSTPLFLSYLPLKQMSQLAGDYTHHQNSHSSSGSMDHYGRLPDGHPACPCGHSPTPFFWLEFAGTTLLVQFLFGQIR